MGTLQGKVVAITGAGGGLGREYALAMAREGARIVVNDLGGARDGSGGGAAMADQVVGEIRAAGGEAVASYASVATMAGAESIVADAVRAFGRLDVLVNNAGILRDKTLLKMSEEMWDLVIAVHLKGTFACSLAAARRLVEQGSGGAIINTTSYAGLKGNYGQANYAAAKAGIYGLTLVQAMELARFGVRVNAIAPMAKTRMTEEIAAVPEAMSAAQVAPMVIFLASDLAKDVSGRVFGVHGEQLFEYRMQMTDGVRGELTAEAIAARLPEIAGEAGAAAVTPAATPAAAPAPATAPAAAPATPAEKVRAIFRFMPTGFSAQRAPGWAAVMHWEVAGTGDFTITVADGKCTSTEGKTGKPTTVIKTSTPVFLGIIEGTVDGTQAFMQGKFSATNVGDVMKYRKAIDGQEVRAAFEASLRGAPTVVATPAAAAPAPAPATAPAAAPTTPAEKVRAIFRFMPAGFSAQRAPGWAAVMHWEVAGTGDFTITVADGRCTSTEGKTGKPTTVIKTSTAVFVGIIEGTVDGTQAFMQGKFSATNVGDVMKYRKAIDGQEVRAAFEASLRGAPAAAATPSAAAPATAATPVASAPAAAAAKDLAAMPPADRLRLLLGLLADAGSAAPGPEAARVHLTVGDLQLTVARAAEKVTVDGGHQGQATSRIAATPEALCALFAGEQNARARFDAGEITASSMTELRWLLSLPGGDVNAALVRALEARGPGVSRTAVGARYGGEPIIVGAKEIVDFAEATNDRQPDASQGIIAPPLFAVRYFNLVYAKLLLDPGLGINLGRMLFGEMQLRWRAPIRPKDLVVVRAQILSLEDKDTGQVMRVGARLMRDGEPVVESVAGFFMRWEKARPLKKTDAAASAQPAAPLFAEPMLIRDDQTVLFAEAANDRNPIHLDDSFAQAMGLPGRILHGMCGMAFCSRAFVERACGGDPSRLVELSVRFSKPARPGQTLTTRALPARRDEQGLDVHPFEAVNDLGEQVITSGVAKIRPAR